ncbi:MAG: Gfo/Idh/MocA family oxidoreductase [Firmicutes bacterium]|nr:Gfo/Idh/MocA family oxidoreductase [Bacillota bacterium]
MKPFRIVIVGCGGMSHTWVEYALQQNDVEIVALVDLFPETAARLATTYGLDVPIHTDLRVAIQATGANLVFDVTIPESHFAVTTAALEHGCAVLGEKPMGVSMEQAHAMNAQAKDCGRSYAIMQNRRYQKQIRAARELIHSGQIGTPGGAFADFFIGAHFGGFRDAMDHPLILDMAIHTFDQARFLLRSDPVSVYCHEWNPVGSWYKGNAAAICLFEMSDGSVFSYRGSWCAEGAQTAWEANWRVTGSLGTVVWDGADGLYAEVVSPGQPAAFQLHTSRIEPAMSWNGREGHHGCLDEMFAALREGRPAETDSADNVKSVTMVFAAIESAASQSKVAII